MLRHKEPWLQTELSPNACFADGLHNLLVQEAIVASAAQTDRTPVPA